jgi:CRP-like cAMP-binding protein
LHPGSLPSGTAAIRSRRSPSPFAALVLIRGRSQVLIQEGDPHPDVCYIAGSGAFDVVKFRNDLSRHSTGISPVEPKDRGIVSPRLAGTVSRQNRVSKEQVVVRTMGKGTLFGELALLFDTPRTATVQASQPSTAWKLSLVRALVYAVCLFLPGGLVVV